MPNDYEQFTERMTSFDLTLDSENSEMMMTNLDAGAYMAKYGLDPHDTLTHYGVKGMKWGIRKGDDGRVYAGKEGGRLLKGKERTQAIKAARERQNRRYDEGSLKVDAAINAANQRAFSAEKIRERDPYSALRVQASAERGFQKAMEMDRMLEEKTLAHPDNKVAMTMTRGEKALTAVSVGGLAVYGALMVSMMVTDTVKR